MSGRAKSRQELPYFGRAIQIDNSASEPDRNRVSPVIRAKLGKYIGHVTFDRRFTEGKVISNQFV